MSWMIPLVFNSAILLISCLIGKVFSPTKGSDVEGVFAVATLMQSSLIWGMFAAYRLNEWYWGLNG
jgi:hypothetical protein